MSNTGNPIPRTGERNTASNLGGGEQIFSAKVGADLEFKSLVAGTNVTLSGAATEVTISAAIDGALVYQGGYDASTNTPNLDSTPTGVSKGDTYVCTVAGTFFTIALEIGDMIIAEIDDPTIESNWTGIERNLTGAVTATAAIPDNAIVAGDGGAQGVQDGGATITAGVIAGASIDATANTVTNVGFSEFDTDVSDTMLFTAGSYIDNPDVNVTSDGATITLSVEKSGGGDLRVMFLTGLYIWDTTPAVTLTLTAGTDTDPVLNSVYFDGATKTLSASTTGFPDADKIHVAEVLCQSAASTQTYGIYGQRNWTDHLSSSTCGHLSHINQWIRGQHATYMNGVVPTLTITVNGGAADDLVYTTTAGEVRQLHHHDFDAQTGTPDVYVVNDPTTTYKRITNLNTALTDSTGGSLSGRRFSLVIWGAVNEDGGDCKLYMNLPGGSYNSNSAVIADASKYANFSIPSEFRGVGFLITELKLRHQTSSSGTWTSIQEVDLRGLFPSLSAGAGSSSASEFSDNTFRIQDDGDATKQIAFEASGITTATTRTITVPDADITLARTDAAQTFTGDQTFDADIYMGDQVYFDSLAAGIQANTTDGTDNALIGIAGGGSTAHTRGSYMILAGNEHAFDGRVILAAGESGYQTFLTNNAEVMRLTNAGNVELTGSLKTDTLSSKSGGVVGLGNQLRASNNVAYGALNGAGSATVDLIKLNTSDEIELSGADVVVSNDLAVDGNVNITGVAGADTLTLSKPSTNAPSMKFVGATEDINISVVSDDLVYYDHSTNEILRLGQDQGVTVGRLLDLSTATAGQIKFPATQNASADANTLDDYEASGNWTINIQDDSRSDGESQTTTLAKGKYTKIGDDVWIKGRIIVSSLGSLTTTQQAVLSGLPFTSSSEADTPSTVNFGYGNGLSITSVANIAGFIDPNTSVIRLWSWDSSGGSTSLPLSELTASGDLIFEGRYEV